MGVENLKSKLRIQATVKRVLNFDAKEGNKCAQEMLIEEQSTAGLTNSDETTGENIGYQEHEAEYDLLMQLEEESMDFYLSFNN